MIEKSDFMCSCGEERKARCEKVMQEVHESLKCDASNVVSASIYNLQTLGDSNEWIQALITSVATDQWAGIRAKVMVYTEAPDGLSEEEEEAFEEFPTIGTLYVQCDQLEHGFARVWQLATEIANEYQAPS